MFNKKIVKNLLVIFIFLQAFNLLLAIINVVSKPNYQPSVWQYLFALMGSTAFATLLLIKITNKKELVELFFGAKADEQNER